MNMPSAIKIFGVVLFGFFFYHIAGIPWFLVPTAGLVCLLF